MGNPLKIVLPGTLPREFICISGPDGSQVESFIRAAVPDGAARFFRQNEPLGQSHALYQAREHLTGPVLMVFPDTLIEADLGFIHGGLAEAVVWVREVADPEHFGIAQTTTGGRVERIVEKPREGRHRLAVVGYYFFPDGEALVDAIEEQLVNDLRTGDEFYLAGAVNLLLERGLFMRTRPVSAWYDGGTLHGLLETNAYLLANGCANFMEPVESDGAQIVPPVFIDPTAAVEGSLIGPNVSIGAGCRITDSVLENTIVEAGAQLAGCRLRDSVIGERAALTGVTGIISAGDDSFFSSEL